MKRSINLLFDITFKLLFIVVGIDAFAQVNQFEHCNALIRHGMKDVSTKISSDVANGYNYHKYCRASSDKMTDSSLAEAEASIFGFGDGSGNYNRERSKEKLDSFCDENKSLASKSSYLYSKAYKYSGPALEAWNACQEAAKELVEINLTHRSEKSSRVTFTIDSSQKGTLYLTGVEYKGYTCSPFIASSSGNKLLSPKSKEESFVSYSETAINNENIHISCDRLKASVDSENQVKTLKYAEGYISIFTTGPSFSITIPEEVDEYHHTPKNSVLAFAESSCPPGWDDYKPAYGRFIRGLDKSGIKIDPDGERGLEGIQEDQVKSHQHIFTRTGGFGYKTGEPKFQFNSGGGGPSYFSTRTESTGELGLETRPKNVALLYCIKL